MSFFFYACRLKHDEDVQNFRQAFYELSGKRVVRLVPVQVVRNDSHLSNDSSEQISSSTSSNNWILQHNYQQPQQHHRQIHHYHQRSRSENRRPRIPWVRSKSPGRDRSYSPLRITSPTWTEPRSPITVPIWLEPRTERCRNADN